MVRRRLPIGIQNFREIRETDCYYVDKTDYISQLLKRGKHYFLSRPRRFGKSLFLDTCKELFEGSEALFLGLAIHGDWDWGTRYRVLRISFASGHFQGPNDLAHEVADRLLDFEDQAGLSAKHTTAPARLRHVIESLHRDTGQRVALLIDEYDKPILDALDAPETARANRDYLRGLYAVIKDCDAHIAFSFITGVSKFSKVSLFSGLNNLRDITLEPGYSAICGYTEADLDAVFAPELAGLDRDEIRDWYNGYGWLGTASVYNPYDILLLLDKRKFEPHWFETGTPTFLVHTLLAHHTVTPDLDGTVANDELLSTFDVDDISPEALLFQTGYLTIKDSETCEGETRYRLGYPNREVRQSLNRSLLNRMTGNPGERMRQSARLVELLRANDFNGLRTLFHAFFASIPHQDCFSPSAKAPACSRTAAWYTNNDIADYEGFYASVFYSHFAALGLDITVEDSTNHGRLDMAVRHNRRVYLIEFKVVELAREGPAMAQLKARRYADKYRHLGRPIHLVAVEFSRDERNLVAFEVADG